MNHKEPVASEGWPFIGIFALLTLLFYFTFYYVLAGISVALMLFCIFFFRNPQRTSKASQGSIIAPADGRIMDIVAVKEDQYIQGDTIRIRIFLSLFNVHVNRTPIAGQVEWVHKVAGIFLPAYRDEAGYKNARNYVGIKTEWGKILVVQITGLVARRLVCWVQPGDQLQTGQRFGLIRFGSCTEIYLPSDIVVLVQPGQKVRGGETPIASFNK